MAATGSRLASSSGKCTAAGLVGTCLVGDCDLAIAGLVDELASSFFRRPRPRRRGILCEGPRWLLISFLKMWALLSPSRHHNRLSWIPSIVNAASKWLINTCGIPLFCKSA